MLKFILRVALLAPASLAAQQDGGLITRIDSIVTAEMARTQTPGIAIAVERHGHLLLARGFGLENVEANSRTSAETVFRIGSITKQFTSTAVMQLVEQGKIGLDDEITKYLPDYPTQGNRVTIRHLLTHTSGIKSYTSLGPKFWTEASRLDLSNDQMLALFKDVPFDFKPGEKYLYNNSAFFLLGVIIEKVTGVPYRTYIDEKVFQPLGLASTSYCDDRAIVPHRAAGYDAQGGRVLNAVPLSLNTPGAAGSLCSTVLDLVRWQQAFDAARPISGASRDQIRTSGKLNDGKATNYGFGLSVGPFEGHRAFTHSGGINGFASWQARYPDDELTVTVLTNSSSGPATGIGELVARVVLGIPLPTLADLPVPAAIRAGLVGRYEINGAPLAVTDGPKGLELSLNGSPAERLFLQPGGEFRIKSMHDAAIRRDPAPGSRQLVIMIEGTTMTAKPVP